MSATADTGASSSWSSVPRSRRQSHESEDYSSHTHVPLNLTRTLHRMSIISTATTSSQGDVSFFSPRGSIAVYPAAPRATAEFQKELLSHVALWQDAVLSNISEGVGELALNDGIPLNIMVAGQRGLGKTTFLNTLLLVCGCNPAAMPSRTTQSRPLYFDQSSNDNVSESQCVQPPFLGHSADTSTHSLIVGNKKVFLSVTDTPGHQNLLQHNEDGHTSAVEFVEEMLSGHLMGEFENLFGPRRHSQQANVDVSRDEDSLSDARASFSNGECSQRDYRVHACIYFLPCTGRLLSLRDIVIMKRLADLVPLIPVIAKADAMAPHELTKFKEYLRAKFENHGIPMFSFPRASDIAASSSESVIDLPAAIISSDQDIILPDKTRTLGRTYTWGSVEVMDTAVSDFSTLAMLLFSHQPQLLALTDKLYRVYKVHHRHLLLDYFESSMRYSMKEKMKALFKSMYVDKVQRRQEQYEAELLRVRHPSTITISSGGESQKVERKISLPESFDGSSLVASSPTPSSPTVSPNLGRLTLRERRNQMKSSSPSFLRHQRKHSHSFSGGGSNLSNSASSSLSSSPRLTETFNKSQMAKDVLRAKYSVISVATQSGGRYNPLEERRKTQNVSTDGGIFEIKE